MHGAGFLMKSEMPWGVSFAIGIPKGVRDPFCAGATGKHEGLVFDHVGGRVSNIEASDFR